MRGWRQPRTLWTCPSTASRPLDVAITPDGAFAYVTNAAGSGFVSVIATVSNRVVATVFTG